MNPGYLFIVGSGRSGTTLLLRCLNASSQVSLLNQTHFMGHLFRPGLREDLSRFGPLSDDAVIKKVVEFLYARPYQGGAYWRWLIKNVDKTVFTQKLLESDRSERAFFSVLMETLPGDHAILGEKTPGHLFYVPTLLEWYPTAKIVHILRDPRAVYVSETRFRLNQKGSKLFPFKQIRQLGLKAWLVPVYTAFYTTIVWSRVIKRHMQYERDYPDQYYALQFEDLVFEPETELRKLCRFLGVAFQPEMLQQVVINTGFRSAAGKVGFDKQAADRWKQHINPVAKSWFSLLWKRHLRKLNYLT